MPGTLKLKQGVLWETLYRRRLDLNYLRTPPVIRLRNVLSWAYVRSTLSKEGRLKKKRLELCTIGAVLEIIDPGLTSLAGSQAVL